MKPPARELYPAVEPYRTGRIKVDPIDKIYSEESDNARGSHVMFLHGGPGAGCSRAARGFFDPNPYQIVQIGYRGPEYSASQGEVTDNAPALLTADTEVGRTKLDIPMWPAFGGSLRSWSGVAR